MLSLAEHVFLSRSTLVLDPPDHATRCGLVRLAVAVAVAVATAPFLLFFFGSFFICFCGMCDA